MEPRNREYPMPRVYAEQKAAERLAFIIRTTARRK